MEKLLSARQDKDDSYETQIKSYVKKLIDAKNSIDQLTEKDKSLDIAMHKFKDMNKKNEQELEDLQFNLSSKEKLLLAKNDEIIRLSRIISSSKLSDNLLNKESDENNIYYADSPTSGKQQVQKPSVISVKKKTVKNEKIEIKKPDKKKDYDEWNTRGLIQKQK